MLISDIKEIMKNILGDSKHQHSTDIKQSARLNLRVYIVLCAKLSYKRTTILKGRTEVISYHTNAATSLYFFYSGYEIGKWRQNSISKYDPHSCLFHHNTSGWLL